MAASGLHSNGYSLARRVLLGSDGPGLAAYVPELGRTIGEEMLIPTRIYSLDCLALARNLEVHAFSHVTGGGLAANLARVLPEQLAADIDRGSWALPPVFDVIARTGAVPQQDMERTFNMGTGMLAVVPAAEESAAITLLTSRGVPAWTCGQVRERRVGEVGDAEAKGGTGGAVNVVGAQPVGRSSSSSS
jgi:phosphoribosylformylglycinamidine cyclo-ligase